MLVSETQPSSLESSGLGNKSYLYVYPVKLTQSRAERISLGGQNRPFLGIKVNKCRFLLVSETQSKTIEVAMLTYVVSWSYVSFRQ